MERKYPKKNASASELLEYIGEKSNETLIGKAVISLLKAGMELNLDNLIGELTNKNKFNQDLVRPACEFLASFQKPS